MNSSYTLHMLQRTRTLVLLLCSLAGTSASAQQKSVDIGLFEGPTPDVLEVRVRANQEAVTGIVSSLTFALRWPNNSGATLGALNQSAIGNACPALRVNISKDAAGEVVDQAIATRRSMHSGPTP